MKKHNSSVMAFVIAVAFTSQAQTNSVWHRQALGQTFNCPSRPGSTYGWPNNNNWSQAQVIGDPCSEGDSLVEQPSNWSTPEAPNGVGYNVTLGSLGGTPANLDLAVTLNRLTIQSDGGLNMQWGTSLTADTIELQGDSGITLGGGGGGWPAITLAGGNYLIKSGGTGINVMGVPVYAYGGIFQINSGTLSLSTGGGGSNATFMVSSGSILDLTGGSSPTWAGQLTGSGAGTVAFNSGTIGAAPSLTLNLSPGLFRWTGGQFAGATINANVVTIAGLNSVHVSGGFYNQGLVHHTNTATLAIDWSAHFDNQAGGIYSLDGDVGMGSGYCCGAAPCFNNSGLVRKSSGTGSSLIAVLFNNVNGAVEVDSGMLNLSGGGSNSNGVFTVASGAALDLTGGSSPSWAGQMTGSGAGQVLLSSGTIATSPSFTLNFPAGLFQWTGGQLAGTTINSNVLMIAGAGTVYAGGAFYNYGLIHHTNTAVLAVNWNSHFENEAGGIYNFEDNGGIASGYCCGGTPYFNNFGLLRKSGGADSTITIPMNNQNGRIEVESGSLVLSGGGSCSNGTVNVASGAVLDLTGGSSPNWAGQLTGTGAGTVALGSGTIATDSGLVFNFPAGMFQWTGGQLAGTTINSNAMTLAGLGGVNVGGVFYNRGVIHHTNLVTLAVNWNSHFDNQAGGIYSLDGDGGMGSGYCCGGTPAFNNYGVLRKSSGTGTSTIGIDFANQGGAIEVDSGTLSVGTYAQGGGAFTVVLGGRGAGQTGRLSASGATLNGPLNVNLANGFAPAPGEQFQILSSAGLSGTFASLNVPAGLAVTYSNNSVFLLVTGTVPAQIVGPALNGTNFVFSFGTVSNQSYTVQRNDNLNTTNWIFQTNLTGNGSLMQVFAPATNHAQRFFRVRQP